jgi:pimeloyl-ACP methyl ester carboxylesterase
MDARDKVNGIPGPVATGANGAGRRALPAPGVRLLYPQIVIWTIGGPVSDLDMATQQARTVASPACALSRLSRRFVQGSLIVMASILVVLIGAGAFLTYRITTAHDNVENVTPASYLLSSFENANITDRDGKEHLGWLLIGLRGAPVVILCHGYDSNRSALLSLGTVLQANHFNVYLFNFQDSGSRDSFSNLGADEASVLAAAISRVRKLQGVDPHHVGLYGTSIGAYAALAAGERDPSVAALALDNVYSRPTQLFDVQLDRSLGGAGWLFRLISRAEFHLSTIGSDFPDVQSHLSSLAGKPKLFLASDDAPTLEQATRRLYEIAPQPKRLVVLPHTQADVVSGPERKEYEDQVLNFFLQNLPLRSE